MPTPALISPPYGLAFRRLPALLFLPVAAPRFIGPARLMSAPPAFLLAGALAGACASGMTTPFDVLKTRVSVVGPFDVLKTRVSDEVAREAPTNTGMLKG